MASPGVGDLDAIVRGLGKKATFEQSVKRLTSIVEDGQAGLSRDGRQKVLAGVTRVATLLKTRYTAKGLWQAGLRLFRSALAFFEEDKAAEKEMRKHIAAAEEYLTQLEDEQDGLGSSQSGPSQLRSAYQFQGQLSSAPPPPAPQPLLTANPALLEALLSAMRVPPDLRADPDAAMGSRTDAEEEDGRRENEEEGRRENEEGVPPIAALQDALLGMLGPESIPGLEEALQASLLDVSPPTVPPASKKAVEQLPTFQIASHQPGQQPVPEAPSTSEPPTPPPPESSAATWPDAVMGDTSSGDMRALGAPPGSDKLNKSSSPELPAESHMVVQHIRDPLKGESSVPGDDVAVSGAEGQVRKGVKSIKAEEMEQKEVCCSVCQEAWNEGDTVREMPCCHRFHAECLQPWLDEHNSCPICRYEMPTDDPLYERRREREKEAEAERKGAANAVQGGTFMYL